MNAVVTIPAAAGNGTSLCPQKSGGTAKRALHEAAITVAGDGDRSDARITGLSEWVRPLGIEDTVLRPSAEAPHWRDLSFG